MKSKISEIYIKKKFITFRIYGTHVNTKYFK